MSCVYDNPHLKLRHLVWEKIIRIGVNRKEIWCLIGDFNEIMHNGKKLGGPRRGLDSFLLFYNMLQICGMDEPLCSGNGFTWVGRRHKLWIQSRLDMCFGNKEWLKSFPAANQAFLELRGSDHIPNLVNLFSSQDSYRGSFRFDKHFLHKPLVKKTIIYAWNVIPRNHGCTVSDKLNCRRPLSRWKKVNLANSREKVNLIQHKLESEYAALRPSFSRLNLLKKDLLCAYREEESFQKQKSRDLWLNEGDNNTRFFHASVKGNRSRNGLEKLLDSDRG